MVPPRFELFGAAHLATLASIALAALGLTRLARRDRARPAVTLGLAGLLATGVALHLAELSARRPLRVTDLLPLHLCDMAIFVALLALLTRRRWAVELLFYWTFTGTLLASVTPALSRGFPTWRFVTYFLLHGGVIIAAAVLVFGHGLPPRRGGAVRAWLLTNLYAALVLVANLALDENYLFLLGKPRSPTLLDLFGPWPVYILVVEALALGLFAVVGAWPRTAGRGF
jgi:hypothetical integral membrane protein (TIGR02206 family)